MGGVQGCCAVQGCMLYTLAAPGLSRAVRVVHVAASSVAAVCPVPCGLRRAKCALGGAVVLLGVNPKQYGMVQ